MICRNCSENALIPNPSSAREEGEIFILWGAETSALSPTPAKKSLNIR
jgi:hypothetical protein